MPAPSGGSTDGGRSVLFEETLSPSDEEGTGGLVRGTRIPVLLVIVAILGSGVAVLGGGALMFVLFLGGIDVALAFANALVAERAYPVIAFFVIFVLGVVGSSLLKIALLVGGMRGGSDDRIHVRVTDAGVSVRRKRGGSRQSLETEVPFDAITAVEYLDPDASSTRDDPDDGRAQKVFGGTSRNWVRLERGDDPAVYVGSDRPVELAETIARRVPGVGRPEPY